MKDVNYDTKSKLEDLESSALNREDLEKPKSIFIMLLIRAVIFLVLLRRAGLGVGFEGITIKFNDKTCHPQNTVDQ